MGLSHRDIHNAGAMRNRPLGSRSSERGTFILHASCCFSSRVSHLLQLSKVRISLGGAIQNIENLVDLRLHHLHRHRDLHKLRVDLPVRCRLLMVLRAQAA